MVNMEKELMYNDEVKGVPEFSLAGSIQEGIKIEIDKAEVYRHLGYGREQDPRAGILSIVDDQVCKAYEFINPAAYYTINPITSVGSPEVSVGELHFTSHNLAQVFSGCSQAAIFVVTIGKALEMEVDQLTKEGSILSALVLDTVGSVAVEKVADELESMFRDFAAAKGGKISWRYSPGYCDWDIAQQKELFRGLDGNPIGVNLTDACSMKPRKSISGIIGGGEFCSVFSACRSCNRKNCPNRREEFLAND